MIEPSLDFAAPDPTLEALGAIAASAAARDRMPVPEFPQEAFAALGAAGALAFNAMPGPTRPPAMQELELVRAVARADGSVGRLYDGHLNGVERLAVQAPEWLREQELEAVRAGRLYVGVWGAILAPGRDSRPPCRGAATPRRCQESRRSAPAPAACTGRSYSRVIPTPRRRLRCGST